MCFFRSSLLKRNILNKINLSKNPLLISTRSRSNYRNNTIGKHPKKVFFYNNLVMGTLWSWILYKSFSEPEHLTGLEFRYPDPSKWTDEELGIPKDE